MVTPQLSIAMVTPQGLTTMVTIAKRNIAFTLKIKQMLQYPNQQQQPQHLLTCNNNNNNNMLSIQYAHHLSQYMPTIH